jgi:hypothetical protein
MLIGNSSRRSAPPRWANPAGSFQPPSIVMQGGRVKRALMTGKHANAPGDSSTIPIYPVQYTARRREPENAVDIMRALLIGHGACPNVIHWDGKHLLAICREQAKWIDGDEPSSRNFMYQLPHGLAGHRKDEVEQLEREESNEMVAGIASNAIKNTSFVAILQSTKV